MKMASAFEEEFCIIQSANVNSAQSVQRRVYRFYGKDSPQSESNYAWCKKFVIAGFICKRNCPRRRRFFDETVKSLSEAVEGSSRKSNLRGSREPEFASDTPGITL